jgi:hypothetical protein
MDKAYILALIGLLGLTPNNAEAVVLGKCKFNTQTMTFAGSPVEQASCLLRKVKVVGNVDAQPAILPQALSGFIGQHVDISKDKLKQFIASQGLDEVGLGGGLGKSLSHGNNNDPNAPVARYFVIHDTSTPNFKNDPFPADINTSNYVNSFSVYKSSTNAAAHIFLNRRGEIYVGHDFGTPWRATKLERKIGQLSKGLFIHIENIQPRRAHPNQADGNAPVPGFSPQQYDRLALIYVVASFRAGAGLIPAFHADIDQGLSDGHDDPQNFSLEDFDTALSLVLNAVK